MRNIMRLPIGRIIVIAFICVWSLFPIYWALNTSLMSSTMAQSKPAHFLPFPIDLSNYKHIFESIGANALWPSLSHALLNTILECIVATFLTVLIAALGAYAFAKMEFWYKNVLFYLVLITLALPAYATLIPLYRLMVQIHLVNTYLGVILVYVSGFIPLAMLILYNYFSTIPKELEEAANIDGASPLLVLVRIIFPISLPGLTSAAIVTFLMTWGQFMFPLILTSDISTKPLTVFMTGLNGRHTVPYTLMNAVGVLSIIVPGAIVIFLNRYIVNGIMAGSGK